MYSPIHVEASPAQQQQPRAVSKWIIGIVAAVLVVVGVIAVVHSNNHSSGSSSGSSSSAPATGLDATGIPTTSMSSKLTCASTECRVGYNIYQKGYLNAGNTYQNGYQCPPGTSGVGCSGPCGDQCGGNTDGCGCMPTDQIDGAQGTFPAPINTGTCEDQGLETIYDPAECLAAAQYNFQTNGLSYSTSEGVFPYNAEFTVYETGTPSGCWPGPFQPNAAAVGAELSTIPFTGGELCVNTMPDSPTTCDGSFSSPFQCLCRWGTSPPPTPPASTFQFITSGTCEESTTDGAQWKSIFTPSTCLAASQALNTELVSPYAAQNSGFVNDVTNSNFVFDSLNAVSETAAPVGCWPMPGQTGTPGAGLATGADYSSLSLCLNSDETSPTKCGNGFVCLCEQVAAGETFSSTPQVPCADTYCRAEGTLACPSGTVPNSCSGDVPSYCKSGQAGCLAVPLQNA